MPTAQPASKIRQPAKRARREGEGSLALACSVLGEYIDHHVKEERNEMFPKARSARRLDLVALREQLETRKAELMGEPLEA